MTAIPESARTVLESAALAHLVTLEPDGSPQYLVIYGTARVTEGGAAELSQRLAHTYLGPDVVFPPGENLPPGYITRITVDRVTGVGPWVAAG